MDSETTRRYRTITRATRALHNNHEWLERTTDPEEAELLTQRIGELEDNIRELKEKNRQRRLNPAVDSRILRKIDTRKRWVERKEATITHYQEKRDTNPRWYDQQIANARLDIENWNQEIKQLQKAANS